MTSASYVLQVSADFLPSPLVGRRRKSEALLRPLERPATERPQGWGAERGAGGRGRRARASNAAAPCGASPSPQPSPARGEGAEPRAGMMVCGGEGVAHAFSRICPQSKRGPGLLPSPLAGEGPGERGRRALTSNAAAPHGASPSPHPSPARGEGAEPSAGMMVCGGANAARTSFFTSYQSTWGTGSLPSPLAGRRRKSEALLRPLERPAADRLQGWGAERGPGERGRRALASNAAAPHGASPSPQPSPARGEGAEPRAGMMACALERPHVLPSSRTRPHPQAGNPCFPPHHRVFPDPIPPASPRRCGRP